MTPIRRCWRPQGRFLRDFARTGSISAACRAAGLPRRTVYNWRAADADFRRRWDAVRERLVGRLRDEVMERALVGDEVPVWHDGRIVDHVREPDPQVLWKLLQILLADIYGPRAAELRARREAERERAADLARRLEEANKRVAAYEARRRAEMERLQRDSQDGE